MPEMNCPAPFQESNLVQLAHGAGGRAMQGLIQDVFGPLYSHGFTPEHDGATFETGGRWAFTTDSYVVSPLFFPGSDIGRLAVHGTVNDLAVCGARPKYLSVSFILEEGLPLETLRQICVSIKDAARECAVVIATGDTKVVGRGQADGVYINTSGIGEILCGADVHPRRIKSGDKIIVSGDLGRHGIAVMMARENLPSANPVLSDCGDLSSPILNLIESGIRPHCLRDLTRGGLTAALHEIAGVSKNGLEIYESSIPVSDGVRGVCEILGFDPLYVANEGRFVAFVAPEDADRTLAVLRRHQITKDAVIAGTVTDSGAVEVVNAYGTRRILPSLHGELLPRIC